MQLPAGNISPRNDRAVAFPVQFATLPVSARQRPPDVMMSPRIGPTDFVQVGPTVSRGGPQDYVQVSRPVLPLTTVMVTAASTPSLLSPQGLSPSSPKQPLSARGVSAFIASPTQRSPQRNSALVTGSSLGKLVARITGVVQERDEECRKRQVENRELDELLSRSREELQQLLAVVAQLQELQQSASEVFPDVPRLGPERPRLSARPPFFWQPSQEYSAEFDVTGDFKETVTKVKDFEDEGWVIPVGGSLRLMRGGLYRWTLRVEAKCPSRPQLQLGVHGQNHCQPWRLVTTSRCSWSRDDEPWQDRADGDRLIEEGSYVHVEVDLRGVQAPLGTFAFAINDEPFEQLFDDIPLNTPFPLIPVVSMGGDQSRVRLCPNY